MRLALDKVKHDPSYYPRKKHDQAQVEKYRAVIDNLPPIMVNKSHMLIDGFHRLQAHKQEKRADMRPTYSW